MLGVNDIMWVHVIQAEIYVHQVIKLFLESIHLLFNSMKIILNQRFNSHSEGSSSSG